MFHDTVSFSDNSLVLGRNTVLRRLGDDGAGAFSLSVDGAHDRMVALLAIAGQGQFVKQALLQLDAAVDDWRRGDRGLAGIRLAFAPLPRLRDHDDAYRLFLAETALDAGMAPNDLLRELGYFACAPLLKFDSNQPRVPSGSGARSGQWTSGDTDGSTAGAASRESAQATPVLFSEGPEVRDHAIDDWWRLGNPGREKERVEGGKPILPPSFAPALPTAPPRTIAPSTAPSGTIAPARGPAPRPSSVPSGTGGGPPSYDENEDNRPACPAQQNDRPRGQNANADKFEYVMSLIVNPLNPTPKQSPVTPNVVSQSYYLPTPTPDGKTSYDDCKQDDTPISIPGVRRGDMFEFKSENFGWQLDYMKSDAYQEFHRQVDSQNAGVAAEGRGRKVFYCLGSQSLADKATRILSKEFPNSRFLRCH